MLCKQKNKKRQRNGENHKIIIAFIKMYKFSFGSDSAAVRHQRADNTLRQITQWDLHLPFIL